MPKVIRIGLVVENPFSSALADALSSVSMKWWYESDPENCVAIIVEGGCVRDVIGLPEDLAYTVIDKDLLEDR